jgi:signal transduction histidine kinase
VRPKAKVGSDAFRDLVECGKVAYLSDVGMKKANKEKTKGSAEEHIAQSKRIEEELRRREGILEAVRFAAERFLEMASWEENIDEVLTRFGEATGASRVYIFENFVGEDGEVWVTQRYEWVAPEVSVQIDNPLLKALPYRAAGFGRWVEVLGKGELVHGHTRDFPESEQPELRAEDILSIVVVPIFVEGEWWGFVGFDECFAEREWSAAEMDALKAAASTLGAAIRRKQADEANRRLSADLQRSRERLVTAREEERRRLRRDLHDGLGPQLASLTMLAEAARDLMPVDPARAEEVLSDIPERAQAAIADVRRLVYALRPPALDALGLIGALRSQLVYHGHSDLQIGVEGPEELRALPAAVEVAAYRIALEALNNVVCHAEASTCVVRLELDEAVGELRLEIEDDGRGIGENHWAGVGLTSMRERTEELGGSCVVEASAPFWRYPRPSSASLPARGRDQERSRRTEPQRGMTLWSPRAYL